MLRRLSSLPRASSSALAVAVGLSCGLGASSCQGPSEPPRVGIVTHLIAPTSLLTRATKLTLTVLEGEATCDVATGEVTFPAGPEGATQIAESELSSKGCATGARYCGELQVPKSEAPRIFSAIARDADSATVALGCASQVVASDAAAVAVTMVRYLAPSVCGDGVLQPTEQCDPGSGPVCDDKCQSKEIVLSVGSASNKTSTGVSGDKTQPFFLWPPSSQFIALYTDRATGRANDVDISMRLMDKDLGPASTPPALTSASIFLPNGTGFPPSPAPFQQSAASATVLQGTTLVAFQDDDTVSPNGLDIHLRSMDASFVAQQGTSAIGINGADGSGEPNIQQAPSIAAGPGGRVFIAWEDAAQGKIVGRTFAPPSTLGNQNDISTGSNNGHVSIAATSTGWIAVWQSGTTIKLRTINADGTPEGAEQTVNEGAMSSAKPSVASLPDDRFAVAFSANDDIFVQRYDARGAKLPSEQVAPTNDVITDGVQSGVAIAATAAVGGSYAVAWLDEASGHVRARWLGGSKGFLFNNVDGSSSEFRASRADGRVRKTPTVASGGSGPFIAIGWEDASPTDAGIVARRFPLPAE